jgi:hypothetical protein
MDSIDESLTEEGGEARREDDFLRQYRGTSVALIFRMIDIGEFTAKGRLLHLGGAVIHSISKDWMAQPKEFMNHHSEGIRIGDRVGLVCSAKHLRRHVAGRSSDQGFCSLRCGEII